MDFQQLETFCTLISDRNMTVVANRLKITQPTVSRQIKQLEEELGVQLLERNSREIRPTAQGQLFFDYAQKILHLVQKAEMEVKSVHQNLKGYLHIATMNYLGMSLVAPLMCRILKPSSQFQMKLLYDSSYTIIEKMKNKEVDIAILPCLKEEYGVELPHYEKHFLFQDSMLFVGSRKDVSLPEAITIQEFTQKPMVSALDRFPQFKMYLEQKQRERNVQIDSILEVNNLGAMKRIIESSFYWGFMPSSSIQKQVQSGRLSVVKVTDIHYKMNVRIYCLKNPDKQKLMELMVLMLKKQNHTSI